MPSPGQIARSAATALAAAYAAVVLAHAEALRAAGVTGTAPPNAGAIKTFVATLTDNALWVMGTVAVLAVVVVGGLFFFGHSRAPDIALRILIGAIILVSATGIGA